jgi:hypothetical protein
VERDALLDCELVHDAPEGALGVAAGHGARGGGGGYLIPAHGGEEPAGVAVRAPVLAHQDECSRYIIACITSKMIAPIPGHERVSGPARFIAPEAANPEIKPRTQW